MASAVSGDELSVREVVCRNDHAVFRSVLRECADRAKQNLLPRITFEIPPDHPLAEFAIRFGADQRRTFRATGGGSGRIVNLQSTFKRMIPEWQERLSRSEFCQADAALRFKTDIGGVALDIRAGTIGVTDPAPSREIRRGRRRPIIRLQQSTLCQLLLGYRTVDSIDVRASAKARRLMNVLFPTRNPHLWPADRF